MKKLGIVILAIGILISVFTGSNIVTREKVMDIGQLEITTNKNHVLAWSPLIGFAVMVIGGAIYFFASKKVMTKDC